LGIAIVLIARPVRDCLPVPDPTHANGVVINVDIALDILARG
jgi:hypothetical protein